MKNLFLLVLLIITSCDNVVDIPKNKENSIELTYDEFLSIANESHRELTEKEVIDIVENFMKSSNEFKSRTALNLNMSVEKKSYIEYSKNKKLQLPLYNIVVNSTNFQDIAIVSGDSRMPFILAYYSIDKKKSDIDQPDNDMMLNISKEMLLNDLNSIVRICDSLCDKTKSKISEKLNIEKNKIRLADISSRILIKDTKNTRANMIIDSSTIPGTVIGRFGPWCEVKWDVGMPYNRTMPQECPNNWLWDNRYAISSVVVAVAQAMAYFQPNMSVYNENIDWSYLKENEEIHEDSDYFGQYVQDPIRRRNMVANLMKYIGEQCGVIYNCNGASVNFSNVINFLSNYGISIDGKQNFDVSKMTKYIEDLNPIIMYGQTSTNGGHWWLIDGMIAVMSDNQVINKYVHANMGMGKSYAGFYYVSSGMTFDASFAHFTKNICMYPNIRR